MPRNPPGNEIDEVAACWAARSDGNALSREQQAELDSWLAADTRHAGAYARALAVLAYYDDALTVTLDAPANRMPGDRAERGLNRRRLFMGGGVAASLLIAAGTAVLWTGSWEQAYATAKGEVRRIELPNGDVVTLNTASRISVRRVRDECRVTLVEGEALFVTSGAGDRRLVVECPGAEMELRPMAASLLVRSLGDETSFAVQSGTVEVIGERGGRDIVKANQFARLLGRGEIAVTAVPPTEIARALAWRSGMIAFDNATLKQAAAEFARYNGAPILVDDAAGDRRVSGLFAASDPQGFARAVSLSLGLRADVSEDEIRISSRG